MAQPPQRPWLRVIVPAAILLVGLGVFWAVVQNTTQGGPGGTSAPGLTQPATSQPPPGLPAATGSPAPASATGTAAQTPGPSNPASSAAPGAPPPDKLLTGLRARDLTGQPGTTGFEPLGSLDDPAATALIEFSPYGAGVRTITLSRYFESIARRPDQHVVVQREYSVEFETGPAEAPEKQRRVLTPVGAVRVEVEGRDVNLTGRVKEPGKDPQDVPVWRQVAPGSFECIVENQAGREILVIRRTYELVPDAHVIHLSQQIENRTDGALRVHWSQFGSADIQASARSLGYGGDKRRVRFGYLGSPSIDPTRQNVLTAAYETQTRETIIGGKEGEPPQFLTAGVAWPRPRSARSQHELVWHGVTDRYFTATVFPWFDPAVPAPGRSGPDKVFHEAATVYRYLLDPWEVDAKHVEMALQSRSGEMVVAPGAAADVSMGVYAGPLLASELERTAITRSLNLRGLVVYNFGGWCGFCTFAWLAHLLLGLLRLLHNWVLFDWALAIIVLVVVVRTILHPVTKWSQIRMARFGKQIGDMAPKQKKLQEKYKDDSKKLREEVARLYREEGVNPAGMLGCLPAFLQTPIWIALYAMLYFAFELRQEAGFFGLFQSISGGKWPFLGDLAEPDAFIPFGADFYVPLLSSLIGPVSGLNLLPLILGAVFFVQQKYLTPPTSATLTPEQEQTQKMVKVMMVVMFPLFMYNAPSGLAIYFITNSSLGIAESKWIRAHMTKHDLLNVKKPVKTGGFLARLQAAMEERQRRMMRRQGKRKP